MSQICTSKGSSVNSVKLPALYSKLNLELLEGLTILDVGCGKYVDHIKALCDEYNITYYGYDKYNQTEETNKIALACNPDVVVSANTLNVIDDDDEVRNVHTLIASYNVPYFIGIYEGNGSGVGAQPKSKPDNWQRNQKLKTYLREDETTYRQLITKTQYKFLLK